jgi:predicted small lipoprotein YifL
MDLRQGCTAIAILLAAIAGCGPKADLDRAEKAVRAALEAWKAGGTPQQLTDRAIEIAEPDWKARYRLLDYQLKQASAQPQQGPRVVVVLTLQDRAGKKVTREVAYEVTFKDQTRVSIGRDAFHVGS